jgi:hypothetical protein
LKSRETLSLSLGIFLNYFNKSSFFECFYLLMRNENLPEKEGIVVSSKVIHAHPPVPASSKA